MSQAGRTRYFLSCRAPREIYRVRPAWLIKRLSCRHMMQASGELKHENLVSSILGKVSSPSLVNVGA